MVLIYDIFVPEEDLPNVGLRISVPRLDAIVHLQYMNGKVHEGNTEFTHSYKLPSGTNISSH